MRTVIKSLPIGYVLSGKNNTYKIHDVLGQGSFGITYLAEFNIISSDKNVASILVAIKEFFMHEINGRNLDFVTAGRKVELFDYYKNKFLAESQNLARLNHPNIIKVIDAFENNNTFYYVMEYVDAGSLDKKIEEVGGLDEQDALSCIRQIGSALSYMHNQGMLHLDVKPSNIMTRSNGDYILIDFGLSKRYDENGDPESSTTVGIGTPGYAPLEQINRDKNTGFPVTMDVYALAATLYKILTGQRPPLPSYILNNGFPSLELYSKGVTEETISAIEQAMSPRKDERPQSIEDFISRLPIFADIVLSDNIEEVEIDDSSLIKEVSDSEIERSISPKNISDDNNETKYRDVLATGNKGSNKTGHALHPVYNSLSEHKNVKESEKSANLIKGDHPVFRDSQTDSSSNSIQGQRKGFHISEFISWFKPSVMHFSFIPTKFKENYKTAAILRYYMGIAFNVFIGFNMLITILSGGMYDYDWDYYYNITHQWMLFISCVLCVIAETMILKGVKRSIYLLISSNLLYWIYLTLIFSKDPKTHISYFELAFIPMLIAWTLCSLLNYYIDKKGKIQKK